MRNNEAMTRERQVETAAAIVLSLATVLTAWSSYQASLWGGEEARHYFEGSTAQATATALQGQGLQRRSVDAALFVAYARALVEEQQALATFLYDRFPPPLQRATKAWLAMTPLTNPAAPPTPMAMADYQIAEETESRRLAQRAADALAQARAADDRSDAYVLLTVIFALVLFFSGISGKFEWTAIDLATLLLSVAILIGGVLRLVRLPTL
jgi:hypothetical protein